MRRFVAILVILSLTVISMPAFCAIGQKGASESALEHASDEAVFHRVGDWFATIGKSPEEKKAVIAERKAKRAAARAQKEAAKKQKELEEKVKKMKKSMSR